jgi:hypothetical protein
MDVIAMLFFQNTDRGLARTAATSSMFKPIHEKTVVFVATLIQHAIEEYSAGTKIINKIHLPTTIGELQPTISMLMYQSVTE